MKISKKAQYGLRAMVFLAKKDKGSKKRQRVFSIREISNIEGIPFAFLSKIFSDLERANLVKAKHGMNGGYFLAKPAIKITTADILLVLEKSKKLVNCASCKRTKNCSAKNVWDKLDAVIYKTLRKTTLQELVTA